MPQLVADVRQALPALNQQARVSMPQGMGLAVAKSSPPQEGPPDVLPERPRGDRSPITPYEEAGVRVWGSCRLCSLYVVYALQPYGRSSRDLRSDYSSVCADDW